MVVPVITTFLSLIAILDFNNMRTIEPAIGYPDEINKLMLDFSSSLVEYMNTCDIGWDFSNYYSLLPDGGIVFTFIRKKKKSKTEYIEPRRFCIYIPSPDEDYSMVLIRRCEFGKVIEDRINITDVQKIIQIGTAWVINLISEYSCGILNTAENEL